MEGKTAYTQHSIQSGGSGPTTLEWVMCPVCTLLPKLNRIDYLQIMESDKVYQQMSTVFTQCTKHDYMLN